MKTEHQTKHDLERSAHCLDWACVLAFSRVLGRLRQPPPVALLQRLLDTFIAYTGGDLDVVENGQRIDYDPSGGFRRARPAAIVLRAEITHWDGSLPVPREVVAAAQEMVAAYGHPAAGCWDDYTVSDDIDDALLWPDTALDTRRHE